MRHQQRGVQAALHMSLTIRQPMWHLYSCVEAHSNRNDVSMTAATNFPDGTIKKLSPQKLHILLGEITALLLASKVHRLYHVRDIADVIFPAINLGQYKIFRNASKQPIALVTWGKLSAAAEKKYLSGNPMLSEQELASGDRLYFMDFIAPYGHMKQVAQHMKKHVFPNDCGRSIRFTANKSSPVKVLKFYGMNYKRPMH